MSNVGCDWCNGSESDHEGCCHVALGNRDEIVARKLRETLDRLRFDAAEAREAARHAEANAYRIEKAVGREEWWLLRGILTADEIESLCNASPSSLLDVAVDMES